MGTQKEGPGNNTARRLKQLPIWPQKELRPFIQNCTMEKGGYPNILREGYWTQVGVDTDTQKSEASSQWEGCMYRHSNNNRSVGQVTNVYVSAHITTAYAHGLEEY